MTYLQKPSPEIAINPPPKPGGNTTNTSYEAGDMHSTAIWHGFNLTAIRQLYDNTLFQAYLPPDDLPASPPRAITAENSLRAAIQEYVVPRVRRA
jgi:hypothetical protein